MYCSCTRLVGWSAAGMLSFEQKDLFGRGAENNNEHFLRIAKSICFANKTIVITGAGVSVAAGIPDFRSADGLYAKVLSAEKSSSSASLKGKDFFDASFFYNPTTRPLFNKFVMELKEMCNDAEPTKTHLFLSKLSQQKRLIRWYTQNIDGLEKATGLLTSGCHSLNPQVVALHGSLDRLICTHCKDRVTFESEHCEYFQKGNCPPCVKCKEYSMLRESSGKRALKCGILRPDIVLYNEPHPEGEAISDYLLEDLSKSPSLLLVMGTSLKVAGLKRMVKDISKAVSQHPDGLILFINKTPASRSEWKSVFDYELIGTCDEWIEKFEGWIAHPPKDILCVNASPLPKTDGRIDKLFRVVRKSHPATPKKELKVVVPGASGRIEASPTVRKNSNRLYTKTVVSPVAQ